MRSLYERQIPFLPPDQGIFKVFENRNKFVFASESENEVLLSKLLLITLYNCIIKINIKLIGEMQNI